MNIYDYENRYRELLSLGAPAWAGEGYLRAKDQLKRVYFWLNENRFLPQLGAPILELGCGNGAMSAQYLAELGHNVWGVDISETAIRWAEKRFQQADLTGHFSVGDVSHLPQFLDSSFSLIIYGSCLHCLINDARQRCFTEIRRLLKPGGRFVLSSMCGVPRYSKDRECYDEIHHHLLKDGHPWRTLRPLPALLREVQEAQFTVHASKVKSNPWWDHVTLVCSV
jgi:SAM-dependent methyltransferase